jgi:hypothetical protein
MTSYLIPRALAPALVALALAVVPAAAQAASPPAATTGNATKITFSGARVHGTVNPRGTATSYSFQYGPTKAYGATTPDVAVGSGTSSKTAQADVAGLAPTTVYHYRVVAKSTAGTIPGADRTFKTAKQPLGLALAATPNPTPFGANTVLAGTLSGTDNAGRQVILQQNAFPFTAGFATVGNPQVTSAQGAFSFPILALTSTTQYRVAVNGKPNIASPIVTVLVSVKVRTAVSHHTVRRGRSVRFAGTITPVRDGAQVAIQKLRGTSWITVGGSVARHYKADRSKYAVTVKINRGGSYRVFVGTNSGDIANNVGTTIKLHTTR